MERDYPNAIKTLKFLIERNTFGDWIHLMNIKPGEVEGNAVNVCDGKKLVLKL